mmetsp:Transcript_13295/g.32288  ORF Transcript_13295/g.32288 Transcript_13295/m.32288 type:complete len:260 (-) Transcript_13295:142-921(-)
MTSLRRDHLVDDAIIHRLLRRHEKVPIAIRLDLILGLIAILGDVSVQHLPDEQYLLRLDLDVGGLSLRPPQRLVDHDAAVGERTSLPRRARPEEEGTHARRHAEAYGGYVARDVLHGVVDGHTGGDAATRAVDVEGDVLGGILVREVEELGDEDVGDLVVHAGAEEDDSVLEETGDYVLLRGAVVDHGHADGATCGLVVGVFAARIHLRLRLSGGRHPNIVTVNGHDVLVLVCQLRSVVAGIHAQRKTGRAIREEAQRG